MEDTRAPLPPHAAGGRALQALQVAGAPRPTDSPLPPRISRGSLAVLGLTSQVLPGEGPEGAQTGLAVAVPVMETRQQSRLPAENARLGRAEVQKRLHDLGGDVAGGDPRRRARECLRALSADCLLPRQKDSSSYNRKEVHCDRLLVPPGDK